MPDVQVTLQSALSCEVGSDVIIATSLGRVAATLSAVDGLDHTFTYAELPDGLLTLNPCDVLKVGCGNLIDDCCSLGRGGTLATPIAEYDPSANTCAAVVTATDGTFIVWPSGEYVSMGGGGGVEFAARDMQYAGPADWLAFATGTDDEVGYVSRELDSASYSGTGSAIVSSEATEQTFRLKTTLSLSPLASDYDATRAFVIRWWAEDVADNYITEIRITGRNGDGTDTVVYSSTVDRTADLPLKPQQAIIAKADLADATLFDSYNVEVIGTTANANAFVVEGVYGRAA